MLDQVTERKIEINKKYIIFIVTDVVRFLVRQKNMRMGIIMSVGYLS